jgi:hypothetical protein
MKKPIIMLGGSLLLSTLVWYGCEKNTLPASETTNPFAINNIKASHPSTSMVVDNLNGPLTTNEISSFKTYMSGVSAPDHNDQNIWVFGNSGKQIEACGLMYDATSDQAILDRMIYFCDAALAGRNDLASAANGGQRTVWTGNIEPVWPSSDASVSPAQAGVEPGDVISHMAFCAKLILQHSALWNTNVTTGDPHGYGATYKARALKYIQQGDYVIDNWLVPRFVRTTDHLIYFPGSPNTYKPNEPAPWNQLFMVTNAMVRLIQCHLILADAASRISQYDTIVQANVNWFKANTTANTSASGTACWKWTYQLPSGMEDSNHAAYDSEGMYIAYDSGRYGISLTDMKTLANTYFDIVLATVTGGIYAGRVDGTTGSGNSGGDNYVRDEYLYLTDIRKDKYFTAGNIEINTNKIASSPQITARLLWIKNRRYQAGDGDVYLYQNCNYAGWKATFDPGNFLLADIVSHGGINDDASSIKIPPGMKVVLYTSNNYGGTAVTLTADDACLSDNSINDMVSSLKVTILP